MATIQKSYENIIKVEKIVIQDWYRNLILKNCVETFKSRQLYCNGMNLWDVEIDSQQVTRSTQLALVQISIP